MYIDTTQHHPPIHELSITNFPLLSPIRDTIPLRSREKKNTIQIKYPAIQTYQ